MLLIQIIILIFIVFMLIKVVSRFKEGILTVKESIIWSIFWIMAAIVIARPSTTAILAKTLGIGRGVDVIIYLSIVLIFYLLFKIKVRTEKIEQEITKIVREQALKENERTTN